MHPTNRLSIGLSVNKNNVMYIHSGLSFSFRSYVLVSINNRSNLRLLSKWDTEKYCMFLHVEAEEVIF